MTRQIVMVAAVLAFAATAHAQPANNGNLSISSFDPEIGTAPIPMVEGTGIKVGEGTTIHPVFGMETGVLSNVFYEETNTKAAGVVRLMAQIGAGSLSGLRLVPAEVEPSDVPQEHKGSFEYRAELRAAYDFL